MGSGASTNTIEVSFIEQETGKILDTEIIQHISDEALKLEKKFYEAFSDPTKLAKMAEEWQKGEEIRKQNIMWFNFEV